MLTMKIIGCSGCSLLTEELRQIGFKLYTGDVERSLVSVLGLPFSSRVCSGQRFGDSIRITSPTTLAAICMIVLRTTGMDSEYLWLQLLSAMK